MSASARARQLLQRSRQQAAKAAREDELPVHNDRDARLAMTDGRARHLLRQGFQRHASCTGQDSRVSACAQPLPTAGVDLDQVVARIGAGDVISTADAQLALLTVGHASRLSPVYTGHGLSSDALAQFGTLYTPTRQPTGLHLPGCITHAGTRVSLKQLAAERMGYMVKGIHPVWLVAQEPGAVETATSFLSAITGGFVGGKDKMTQREILYLCTALGSKVHAPEVTPESMQKRLAVHKEGFSAGDMAGFLWLAFDTEQHTRQQLEQMISAVCLMYGPAFDPVAFEAQVFDDVYNPRK